MSSAVETRAPGFSTSLEANGGGGNEPYVRIDDGVAEGGEVSRFYDPMIAKLVTWGETRDEAADKQIAALDAFEIEGLGHNIDFVSAIMQHPRFRAGELTTGFIAEEYPEGFHGAPASPQLLRSLAAIAGFAATAEADRARRTDGQLGRRLRPPAAWTVRIGGVDHAVALDEDEITVDGEPLDLAMEYTPGDRLIEAEISQARSPEPVEGRLADESRASTSSALTDVLTVRLKRTRSGFTLTTRGATHHARCLPAHIAPLAAHMIEKIPPDLSRFLICPMPGLLVALNVGVGDAVEAGQPLAVVEAMKMENILRAGKSGRVRSIHAAQGDSLAVDAVILEME